MGSIHIKKTNGSFGIRPQRDRNKIVGVLITVQDDDYHKETEHEFSWLEEDCTLLSLPKDNELIYDACCDDDEYDADTMPSASDGWYNYCTYDGRSDGWAKVLHKQEVNESEVKVLRKFNVI